MKNKILKKLKSAIGPLIVLIIIIIGIFVVITYKNTEEEEEIIAVHAYGEDKDSYVLENDKLKFELNPETTNFTIEVKSSGKIWYSNPEDADTDGIALTAEKGKLKSNLLMTYSTVNGLETLYDSYSYSVEKGIYEIEEGEDYIKVNYSLGNLEKEYVIPPVCTEEEMESLCANMKNDYANMVHQYYKKYDINDLGKKDDKDELLATYPILAEKVIYVLRDSTKENLKVKFQDYFADAGYTYEMFLADKELSNAESSQDKPIFNISMVYRLDGDDLVVEVPMSEMENKEEYPIYNVTVLPYFGAGGTEDNGFLFVPEGGGALINFNNGKTAQNSYYANMYGWDMNLFRDSVVHNTRTYFNTFGVSDTDSNNSFICMLEGADAYASIQADISGRYNEYNYVNAVYSVMLREEYDVSDIAASKVFSFQENLPDETIIQRYSFIDSSDYVDMAKAYKSYLEDNYGDYLTMNDDTEAPLVVEIVGAADKVKQVLGVPVSRPLELTSYDEALELVQDITSKDVNNLSIKYTGWCNGGENQKVLTSVKTISELGSSKDLKNMISESKNLGVNVYLDGVTDYAYDSNFFDGFMSFRDAARFITKERSEIFKYSQVDYGKDKERDNYYVVHSSFAQKMATNLIKAANKYGAGVSFRDRGQDLSGDYYEKNFVSRQDELEAQRESFKELADSDTNVNINMGNVYAAVYSDLITNMDLKGSEYTILDSYVPFYEIAIHGYVDYTGTALNLSGETNEELLHCAEYGAGLYMTFMKESAFTLQNTLYSEYFGADYDAIGEDMLAIYERYNSELGSTFNQEMTGHEQLTNEVSCTEYADGTKVYVNYSYADYKTADGVLVPSRDYKVIK